MVLKICKKGDQEKGKRHRNRFTMVFRKDPCGFFCILMTYGKLISCILTTYYYGLIVIVPSIHDHVSLQSRTKTIRYLQELFCKNIYLQELFSMLIMLLCGGQFFKLWQVWTKCESLKKKLYCSHWKLSTINEISFFSGRQFVGQSSCFTLQHSEQKFEKERELFVCLHIS